MRNKIPFKGLDIGEALLVAASRDKGAHTPSEGEAERHGKPKEEDIPHGGSHSRWINFDNIAVEISVAMLVIITGLISVAVWPL